MARNRPKGPGKQNRRSRRSIAADVAPIEPIYEDNHCLAVVKPAGMLTMGDRSGDVSLVDAVRDYLRNKYQKPGRVFVGVVHRLDRPVGGIVLFARTSKSAARLSAQFRAGEVTKVYHALVEGKLLASEGELVHRLTKDPAKNLTKSLPASADRGRLSVLAFRRLAVLENATLLEIRPTTGRSHQIRAQLTASGHPIVGDRKYGSKRSFSDGIALRAVELTFKHPTQQKSVTLRTAAHLA